MSFVDPRYAKSETYAKDLAEIQAANICPFCPDGFKWHPNPVLARDGDWFVTASGQKYDNAERHLLIIGDVHKEELWELTDADMCSILELAKVVTDDQAPGGALAFRFGDTNYTGATVKHLHVHIIVPQIDPETKLARPVMFPVG